MQQNGKSVKLSTDEMLDLIPYRGRDIDCNYYVYCRSCKKRQRLWHRAANREMREKMVEGLSGMFDCPACVIKRKTRKTVEVLGKIPVKDAIYALYLMGKSTGIDYDAAERFVYEQGEREKVYQEDQAKVEWLLQQSQQ